MFFVRSDTELLEAGLRSALIKTGNVIVPEVWGRNCLNNFIPMSRLFCLHVVGKGMWRDSVFCDYGRSMLCYQAAM